MLRWYTSHGKAPLIQPGCAREKLSKTLKKSGLSYFYSNKITFLPYMKSAKQNSIRLSYGKLKTDKPILDGEGRGEGERELIIRKNLHNVSLVHSVRDKSP